MPDVREAIHREVTPYRPASRPAWQDLRRRADRRLRRRRGALAAASAATLLSVASIAVFIDRSLETSRAIGDGQDSVQFASVLPAGDVQFQAAARGMLEVDRASGCVWLSQSNSDFKVRIWLAGDYRVAVDENPARIYRDDKPVAVDGEQVELSGGVTTGDERPAVAGCPIETSESFTGYFPE